MVSSSRVCTLCPLECKKFNKCTWASNPNLPEHFQPSISGVLGLRRGQKYIVLTNMRSEVNEEVIDWYIADSIKNGYNLAYRRNNQDHFIGDPNFVKLMYGSLGSS
jgi:hypothetical protein